ncbi:Aldehyde dehydrogenase mitochondrial [Paragonimus heterotremus]|uniref:Aldehyde dehydrogenase mitochondrial n=1 Tax=Paragonimus heterotremus TaxID=100268 RepID=A0A8J4T2Y3_9TREM|nr:Aldehyde dehydrogenase mitochondrial [Paragonimus heterotremus]
MKPEVKYTQLFINNEFVDSVSGKTFPTVNPTTEEVICHVQQAEEADVKRAVEAAKVAFRRDSPWRTMDASARGLLLYKLADALEKNANHIAGLDALDNGKAFTSALGDIMFSVNVTRYYAGYADKIHGKQLPADGDVVSFTRREPAGVVAGIIPWNYPAFLCVQKMVAILAAGCTVVLKPAEQTPLSALYIGSLVREVGFPPGVVNILPGYGETAGAPLCLHPDVRVISFTGSTEVGQIIMRAAASNIKHVKLELGGKSPLIIFADADFEKAAAVAHEATMVNHGQCCVAATRIFVQAPIYDKMVQKLKQLAEARKVGDPFDEETIQGPQVDDVQFEKVMSYIEAGKKQGARLVTGGCRIGNKGYFVQPTVFADVTDEMSIAKEEIFGPVQSILRFETVDEVIDRANSGIYGLGAGVFTSDMEKAMRVAQACQAGSFWINCYNICSPQAPFGGYKMSGLGKELGKEGLDCYLQTKVITLPISLKNS